jgi:hypothetical protein
MVTNGTKYLLNLPESRLTELAHKYAMLRFKGGELQTPGRGVGLPARTVVRLRDFFFPMFVRYFYEMLFNEEASDEFVEIARASGENVNVVTCIRLIYGHHVMVCRSSML